MTNYIAVKQKLHKYVVTELALDYTYRWQKVHGSNPVILSTTSVGTSVYCQTARWDAIQPVFSDSNLDI